jgi:hypothetical protein
MNRPDDRPDAVRGKSTSDPRGATLPLFLGFGGSLAVWAVVVTILILVG